MAFGDLARMTQFDIEIAGGGPGVNPYSGRGLRGRLSPIAEAKGEDKFPRAVNGGVVDLSAPQMRKYTLDIYGHDMAPPALDNLWPGTPVGVSCLTELAILTNGGLSFSRTPVDGSVRTEGDYTYYRPFFNMIVVDWDAERDEWPAETSWHLVLTES